MHVSPARPVDASSLRALRPDRAHGCLPPALWLTGTPCGLAAPTVGIVGTRAPSSAAERFAERLARELAQVGVCVVSGLARGIDGAAHRGALAGGGATIGVLAGGHDFFYPREHAGLAAAMIAAGGAVVSPHPPSVPPLARRFLERNGIIAALSDAIVIVEAPVRSGALNTAAWAADAGIPVLAVPGDVDRPKVAGCLALIRDGATLARDTNDVLEALGIKPLVRSRPRERVTLAETPCEARVLGLLDQMHDATLDDFATALEEPIDEVIRTVQTLVLRGAIDIGTDGRHTRARHAASIKTQVLLKGAFTPTKRREHAGGMNRATRATTRPPRAVPFSLRRSRADGRRARVDR